MYKPILNALILLIPLIYSTSAHWDFGVTTKTKIIFFDEHWNEVTSAAHQFDQLSAITFDETEEIIYFNDELHQNGSIFSLKIPISSENAHIIEGVVERTKNETVNSIVYDPIDHALYWVERRTKKIFMSVINTDGAVSTKVLIDFKGEDTLPDGLAIDICRRKLYWTNANHKNATVERSDLSGLNRQVLINSSLFLPHGIVVDQLTDRIYWVVDQEGIHFSVESAALDGTDRMVIVKGLNNVPINLAVTKDAIFWTDFTNNAVWAHPKNVQAEGSELPHKVLEFSERPRGIVARSNFLNTLQNDEHCSETVRTLKSRLFNPKPTRNPVNTEIEKLQRNYCFNGAEFIVDKDMCICRMGFKGARCEISECHNYCVHGSCSMSSMGYPQCSCQKGFYGERCEASKCADYCLNDGLCKINNDGEPSCQCKNNFGGQRCDHNSTEICSLFCRILKHEPETYVPFGCHDICQQLSTQSEDSAEIYALPEYKHLEVCMNKSGMNSTAIIVLVCGVVICLCLVLFIVLGIRRMYKPLRPRIKKTFVVRKQAASSDTPLTNRPMATEQCEITIENCCNMNICDTPCFDPKLVSQSLSCDNHIKDDKKVLIHNMEDELY